MTDRLKPNTKQWHDRQRRHQHNSYMGHVAMCQANMHAIYVSPTTTPEAKALADRIGNLAFSLGQELRKRVDA